MRLFFELVLVLLLATWLGTEGRQVHRAHTHAHTRTLTLLLLLLLLLLLTLTLTLTRCTVRTSARPA